MCRVVAALGRCGVGPCIVCHVVIGNVCHLCLTNHIGLALPCLPTNEADEIASATRFVIDAARV